VDVWIARTHGVICTP